MRNQTTVHKSKRDKPDKPNMRVWLLCLKRLQSGLVKQIMWQSVRMLVFLMYIAPAKTLVFAKDEMWREALPGGLKQSSAGRRTSPFSQHQRRCKQTWLISHTPLQICKWTRHHPNNYLLLFFRSALHFPGGYTLPESLGWFLAVSSAVYMLFCALVIK